MNNYQIFTDSTCDLSSEIYTKHPIIILPMDFTLDATTYTHTHDFKNFSATDFYQKLATGSTSTTSQINPTTFKNEFEKVLQLGHDVLYIGLSSGLSGTIQSSLIAKAELENLYPHNKIEIIDSLGASAGQGLLVYRALVNQKNGMTIEENATWLKNNIHHLAHWFTVDDLMFLKRGGRISSAAAMLGTALRVKPILHVDDDGRLASVSKAHGRKASLTACAEKLAATIIEPANQTIFISHAEALEDAQFLANKIEELCPVKEIVLSSIGPVIGSHSGPGTVALFFFATQR